MSGVGESRTELLNWLNEWLQLNYKKIEECGTGAAYCQIFDSIYGDIPMHRVKFNAIAQYDFQTNYKILQSCFTKHHIEKTVYVDKLIKCKFQDNLEFLQWVKKFWLQNKDESPYDPNSRRKYRPSTLKSQTPSTNGITKSKATTHGLSGSSTGSGNVIASRSSSYGASKKISNEQMLGLQTELSNSHSKLNSLNDELNNYKNSLDIMERERAFYFGKLRDIEILVQSTEDLIKEGVYNNASNSSSDELYKFIQKVQKILYATEEGFEVNNDGEERTGDEQIQMNNADNRNMPVDEITGNGNELLLPPVRPDLESGNSDLASQNLIIDEETF